MASCISKPCQLPTLLETVTDEAFNCEHRMNALSPNDFYPAISVFFHVSSVQTKGAANDRRGQTNLRSCMDDHICSNFSL